MLFLESGLNTGITLLPYLTIIKTSNVLDTLDTCLTRHERSTYSLLIHDNTKRGVETLSNSVETILQNKSFPVANRKVTGLFMLSKHVRQLALQHYQAALSFEIFAEKRLSSAIKLGQQGTLFNLLKTLGYPVTLSAISTTNRRPYITVPEFITRDAFWTTRSQHETVRFDVVVSSRSAREAETIQEDIDNTLSYAKVSVDNKRFTNIRWLGDTLQEVKKYFWQASVQYEMTLEKDIV